MVLNIKCVEMNGWFNVWLKKKNEIKETLNSKLKETSQMITVVIAKKCKRNVSQIHAVNSSPVSSTSPATRSPT